QLANRWREIDDFEGAGYERRSVDVTLGSGAVVAAQIYVALTDS
ncbi:MAG: gamma-glutamylcyclotransferase, partial [Acidimicrobiaceae bacterium]|nr:gamma-glutamylcyclotransferase [Acidimicrobiaceae bacterium]